MRTAHRRRLILSHVRDLATRAATLPIYVTRKKPWFRPTTVVFGQPFHPQIAGRKATAEELDQITHTVMDQIHQLGEGLE